MTSPAKVGLTLLAIALGVVVVYKLVAFLMGLVLPLAIIAGIGLILYSAINRKSLGASRRYLP